MTPRKSHRQSRSSDGVDIGLEFGGTVFKTLESVAKVCPVPGLSEAAKLALQITEVVKAVRANQEGFKRLAIDASQLVYVIIRAHKDISHENQADPNLIANLDHVLVVLDGIEEFASKGASRSRFVAFWRSSLDAGKITEHREMLQQCLDKFGFESEISIRVMVVRLAAQHEKMIHLLESNGPSGNNNVAKDQDKKEVETTQVESSAPREDAGAHKDPGNQRASNTISIGTGANFSGAAGIAIGTNNNVNYGVNGH